MRFLLAQAVPWTGAMIDLRHANFIVKDGTRIIGAVNQPVTAPLTGDATLTIDGLTVAIPVGITFTVVGSTRPYTVVSTVGGSTPTSVTFTPALATADGIPIDNAVITFGPRILDIKMGEGNLTYEEKRTMTYVRNKRSIISGFVMTGDDEPVDVSIDAIWEFIGSTGTEPLTPDEFFKQTGNGSTLVTAGADPCEPYAVIIEILYTPPCPAVDGERILLNEFRWESFNHDTKAGTIAIKGKCKILFAITDREVQPLVA